MVLTLVNFL